jgi:hypothetical protein
MAISGNYDALIALGAVIRGETYHFEIVSNESARGITERAARDRRAGRQRHAHHRERRPGRVRMAQKGADCALPRRSRWPTRKISDEVFVFKLAPCVADTGKHSRIAPFARVRAAGPLPVAARGHRCRDDRAAASEAEGFRQDRCRSTSRGCSTARWPADELEQIIAPLLDRSLAGLSPGRARHTAARRVTSSCIGRMCRIAW